MAISFFICEGELTLKVMLRRCDAGSSWARGSMQGPRMWFCLGPIRTTSATLKMLRDLQVYIECCSGDNVVPGIKLGQLYARQAPVHSPSPSTSVSISLFCLRPTLGSAQMTICASRDQTEFSCMQGNCLNLCTSPLVLYPLHGQVSSGGLWPVCLCFLILNAKTLQVSFTVWWKQRSKYSEAAQLPAYLPYPEEVGTSSACEVEKRSVEDHPPGSVQFPECD